MTSKHRGRFDRLRRWYNAVTTQFSEWSMKQLAEANPVVSSDNKLVAWTTAERKSEQLKALTGFMYLVQGTAIFIACIIVVLHLLSASPK